MKGFFNRIALAIVSVAMVVSLTTTGPRAQGVPGLFGASGNPVWTGVITTQNPTGSSPILPLAGHVTCSIVASNTTAGTNITVFGSAQVVPNTSSQWFPNPNFGTSGVISVSTSPVTTTGNIANYPGGLYFSWGGNTGTLTAYATCSTATQAAGGSGTSNVTIVGPVAASPAPSGLPANGYNSSGLAAPIICIHQAQTQLVTTLPTSTTLVPAVAGKAVYVCAYSVSSAGGGFGGLFWSAGACSTPITNVIVSTAGTSFISVAGYGLIGLAPAGANLCFANNSTAPTQSYASVMFEQFFRSLSAQEIIDRCALPKRCVLYGLFKHLDRLLDDHVTPP